MNVIGPSCSLPSDNSSGCGCAPSKKIGGKAAAAASVTALTAIACTACCLLPFTLPATLLAIAGGSISVLDHAHGWMTWLAIASVVGAWSWIAWQRRKTRQPIALRTTALMVAATFLTATTASWPLIEPAAFRAMGIVKKTKNVPQVTRGG